jgi:hypothetical protein
MERLRLAILFTQLSDQSGVIVTDALLQGSVELLAFGVMWIKP